MTGQLAHLISTIVPLRNVTQTRETFPSPKHAAAASLLALYIISQVKQGQSV